MSRVTSARESDLRGQLPGDVRGVRVGLADRREAFQPLVLHGAFRVPHEDLPALPSPVQRGLVLVAPRALAPLVVAPFTEEVLFEDDQVMTHIGAEGAFRLDVFDLVRAVHGERGGHWHLFVALGPHLSNIVHAFVTG